MKAFCFTMFVSSIIVHCLIWETKIAQKEASAYMMSNNILHEQIDDMAQELAEYRNLPTYEEGLRDGIQNTKSVEYMAGYHNGLKHGSDHQNERFISKN